MLSRIPKWCDLNRKSPRQHRIIGAKPYIDISMASEEAERMEDIASIDRQVYNYALIRFLQRSYQFEKEVNMSILTRNGLNQLKRISLFDKIEDLGHNNLCRTC